jgi:hypothetical protein
VICAGLLSSAGTGSLLGSAAWQWLNRALLRLKLGVNVRDRQRLVACCDRSFAPPPAESYNVAVNFANRSSGAPPAERVVLAYTAATSSALAVAIGLQAVGARAESHLASAGGTAGTRSHLRHGIRLTVPMLAVALGSVVNLLLTRNGELADGIPVTTEDGVPLGHSRSAARDALSKCAATRVAWTVALLTLAPLATAMAARALPASLATRRSATFAVECCVSFAVIWAAVPMCIAIWPQRQATPPASLEDHFHKLRHPVTGVAIDKMYFNRGL